MVLQERYGYHQRDESILVRLECFMKLGSIFAINFLSKITGEMLKHVEVILSCGTPLQGSH